MSEIEATNKRSRLCRCVRCGGALGNGKTLAYSTYMRHQAKERLRVNSENPVQQPVGLGQSSGHNQQAGSQAIGVDDESNVEGNNDDQNSYQDNNDAMVILLLTLACH